MTDRQRLMKMSVPELVDEIQRLRFRLGIDSVCSRCRQEMRSERRRELDQSRRAEDDARYRPLFD